MRRIESIKRILHLLFITECIHYFRIYSKKQQTSPQSEKAPILTLADLTPAPSETGSMNESLNLLRSGHLYHMYSSLQDDRVKEERRKQVKKVSFGVNIYIYFFCNQVSPSYYLYILLTHYHYFQ